MSTRCGFRTPQTLYKPLPPPLKYPYPWKGYGFASGTGKGRYENTRGLPMPITNKQNNPTQALREDILNLRVAMQSETTDNETQASSLSQMEGKKDQYTARAECKGSEFNMIFWDIEVIRDLSSLHSSTYSYRTPGILPD